MQSVQAIVLLNNQTKPSSRGWGSARGGQSRKKKMLWQVTEVVLCWHSLSPLAFLPFLLSFSRNLAIIMDFVYSEEVDPNLYETHGLAGGIPLRRKSF